MASDRKRKSPLLAFSSFKLQGFRIISLFCKFLETLFSSQFFCEYWLNFVKFVWGKVELKFSHWLVNYYFKQTHRELIVKLSNLGTRLMCVLSFRSRQLFPYKNSLCYSPDGKLKRPQKRCGENYEERVSFTAGNQTPIFDNPARSVICS